MNEWQLRLQARLNLLSGLIEQAGKRLSKDTVARMKEIMSKMSELIGSDDIEEQSVTPTLLQSTITGESIDE
jgi:DNA-binding GntR family transcriptional regulator